MNNDKPLTNPETEQTGLPAWRVILAMVRFRAWFWFVDLVSVTLVRLGWQILPGLVMKEFFDLISGEASAGINIWTIAVFIVMMFLLRAAGEFGFYYADVPIFNEIATLLRSNILKHVLNRPGAKPLPDSPGEAVSRFREDVMEIPLFAIWINDIIVGTGIIIVSIVIMLRINVPITLLALVPLLLVGLLANAASRRISTYRKASRKATGEVTGFIGELFGSIQAVKVASAEANVIRQFDTLNENRRKMALRERLYDQILDSVWHNMANLGTGLVLILASDGMSKGDFTVGDFALFAYLLQSIGDLTTFYGMIVARYRQLSVSVERMYRLMEGAPADSLVETRTVNLEAPPLDVQYPTKTVDDRLESLRVEGLAYTFPGSQSGIRDISFGLKRGSLTVITGRVGSGKTTLLRVLLGLLTRDQGQVYWNDKTVEDLGAFFTPPRTAYTAQIPRLFSDTLRSNVLLGMQKTDEEIRKAVYQAVLDRDLESLEAGLDTKVGPRGVKLSGGQAQRTAAARMLIREPELLVFDDLSSALDVETEQMLWDRLFPRSDEGELSSEFTCLVVTHRKPVLKMADQIILLKDGHVEAVGTLSELMSFSPEMQSLWKSEPDRS